MDREIIVLSGSPGSGKDTITQYLTQEAKAQVIHFSKHRSYASPHESKDGYINVAEDLFLSMVDGNDFFQYHQRYGRYYGISYGLLSHYKKLGIKPIIHNGRLTHLNMILNKNEFKILSVLIWIPLDVLRDRLKLRHRGDEAEIQNRYRNALEEFQELKDSQHNLPFDLAIQNTDLQKTADILMRRITCPSSSEDNGLCDLRNYLSTLRL